MSELESEWAVEDGSIWGNQFLSDLASDYAILPAFLKKLVDQSKCDSRTGLSCLRQSEWQNYLRSRTFTRLLDALMFGNFSVLIVRFIQRPDEIKVSSQMLIFIISAFICDQLEVSPFGFLLDYSLGGFRAVGEVVDKYMDFNLRQIVMGEIYLNMYKKNTVREYIKDEKYNIEEVGKKVEKFRNKKRISTGSDAREYERKEYLLLQASSYNSFFLDFNFFICRHQDGNETIQLYEDGLTEYVIHVRNNSIKSILSVLESMGIEDVILKW